jgi:hypothetical protein
MTIDRFVAAALVALAAAAPLGALAQGVPSYAEAATIHPAASSHAEGVPARWDAVAASAKAAATLTVTADNQCM